MAAPIRPSRVLVMTTFSFGMNLPCDASRDGRETIVSPFFLQDSFVRLRDQWRHAQENRRHDRFLLSKR
jgi:hypothetical protein